MVRVAITLPDDVFQAAEKMRLESDVKLTRSQFFRAAVEEYVGKRIPTKESLDELEVFFEQDTEDDLNKWVAAAAQYAFDAEDSWEEHYKE